MIVSDSQILYEMKTGRIVIDPFDASQLNPNSYDLRLGNLFYLVLGDAVGPLFVGPLRIEDGQKVFIPNCGTLLGMTKEVFGTTQYDHVGYVGELRAKSSTCRRGVSVCSGAGFGDVGYINHWTVELTGFVANGSSPFLVVGERFAQAVFFGTSNVGNLYSGQYKENDWPACMIPKKYRDDPTRIISDPDVVQEVFFGVNQYKPYRINVLRERQDIDVCIRMHDGHDGYPTSLGNPPYGEQDDELRG